MHILIFNYLGLHDFAIFHFKKRIPCFENTDDKIEFAKPDVTQSNKSNVFNTIEISNETFEISNKATSSLGKIGQDTASNENDFNGICGQDPLLKCVNLNLRQIPIQINNISKQTISDHYVNKITITTGNEISNEHFRKLYEVEHKNIILSSKKNMTKQSKITTELNSIEFANENAALNEALNKRLHFMKITYSKHNNKDCNLSKYDRNQNVNPDKRKLNKKKFIKKNRSESKRDDRRCSNIIEKIGLVYYVNKQPPKRINIKKLAKPKYTHENCSNAESILGKRHLSALIMKEHIFTRFYLNKISQQRMNTTSLDDSNFIIHNIRYLKKIAAYLAENHEIILSEDNFIMHHYIKVFKEIKNDLCNIVTNVFNKSTNLYIQVFKINFDDYKTSLMRFNLQYAVSYQNIIYENYKRHESCKDIIHIPFYSYVVKPADLFDNNEINFILCLQSYVKENIYDSDFLINNLNMLMIGKIKKNNSEMLRNIDYSSLRTFILQILQNSTIETLTFFLELPLLIDYILSYKKVCFKDLFLNFYAYTTFLNILSVLVSLDWNYKANIKYDINSNSTSNPLFIQAIAKSCKQRMHFYMILLCVIRPFISPIKYNQIWHKILLQSIFFFSINESNLYSYCFMPTLYCRFFLFQIVDISLFSNDRDIYKYFSINNKNPRILIMQFIIKYCNQTTLLKLFQSKKNLLRIVNYLRKYCWFINKNYRQKDNIYIFTESLFDPINNIVSRFDKINFTFNNQVYIYSSITNNSNLDIKNKSELIDIIDD
ncbi:hypothetical protein COBT_000759, partial [Conglomerata obtusa]